MKAKLNVDLKVDGTKIYDENISPVTRPIAETAGLIPRAIKAALSPIEKWILHREHQLEEVKIMLEKKHINTLPEKIVEPEPYVAVPAIEALSYAMDSEDLRELYANLLSKAINVDYKEKVHPAMVEIIKQMSPLDARIYNHILTNYVDTGIAMIDIGIKNPNAEPLDLGSNFEIYEFGSNYIHVENTPIHNGYFLFGNTSISDICTATSNLKRLGLIDKLKEEWLEDTTPYIEIENSDSIQDLINGTLKAKKTEIVLTPCVTQINDFGKSFGEICIKE